MMRKSVVLLAAFVLSCLQIASQETKPQPWSQEPTSFLGIQFSQPLRASVVECPKITEYGSTHYEPVNFGRPCFKVIQDFYEIDSISPFFDIFVTEIDGKVEHIGAKFNNGNKVSLSPVDANGVAAALVDKFGDADQSKTEVLHNNAGAEYENHILRWQGKNVSIEFDSVSGEYNHGYVGASTAIYAAYIARKQGQQQNSVKGVL